MKAAHHPKPQHAPATAQPAANTRSPHHGHRHSLGHEHEVEPQYGLPELLPAGEQLLWQGSPRWQALALEVFHARKLALYFAVILLLRAGFVVYDGGGLGAVLKSWAWLLPLAAVAVGTMVVLARLAARTTVYSITDKRVVMRIGIVLTVAYNLPFKQIESAGLMLRGADGHGDIPIRLNKGERIAILHLWPHARPWRLARPEPMLRGLAHAAQVGQVLAQAWQAARGPAAQAPVAAAPTATAGAAAEPASQGPRRQPAPQAA
jgi:hypothetical protein